MDKKFYKSQNVILGNEMKKAGILINSLGKIESILLDEACDNFSNENTEIIDVNELIIMPGVVDSHVHVNEPGRTDWEGYETATKAAAAGGITTIIDMPLNSNPPTISVKNLETKIESTKNKIYVDVAFWGGAVPGNEETLKEMVEKGVIGFKCFTCPSGIDEFPNVNEQNVDKILKNLQGTDAVFAFHAEIVSTIPESEESQFKYETFLKSRPEEFEIEAIRMIIRKCQKYKVHCHIVHLSAANAIPLIEDYKSHHSNLTVETCHHYLTLSAENVPDKATQYKCCPPIRNSTNKEKLWTGLKNKVIDMVVSDHSPCTPDLKYLDDPNHLDYGNFMKAWGGISSVQFGLSLFWTEARKRNMTVFDVVHYLCEKPAEVCGLNKIKGKIAVGLDGDLVIWNPNSTITIKESNIHHKNKKTPYLGMTLYGKVEKTVSRGKIIYDGEFKGPFGKLILK